MTVTDPRTGVGKLIRPILVVLHNEGCCVIERGVVGGDVVQMEGNVEGRVVGSFVVGGRVIGGLVV